MKPSRRPKRPEFSSGPCAKRPGWSLAALEDVLAGRSHRAKPCKERLKEVIDRSRSLLDIPDDYRVGIVPASDTGAVEMALWSLLGARGVEILAWESFGSGWVTDIVKQLGLADAKLHKADYGALPDLSRVSFDNDVVFTWNGTTSGVCVPDADWIPELREGLAICDATSAVFAMDVPFAKLDVVTWSWQKALGGEGGHGMLVLSPRAVERLESYAPERALPKIFRMTKGGKLIEGIFRGETINTPSMLCVEDALDALRWCEGVGGSEALRKRSRANLAAIEEWVGRSEWADFLADDPSTRSCTSICLKIVDPWFTQKSEEERASLAKGIGSLLDAEGVAYDINSYRDAPAGLRIWGGSTVEHEDIEALLPWLDWAYQSLKSKS
jgi:phosphoserine aminotransferase